MSALQKVLMAAKAYVALVGALLTALAGIYGDRQWYAVALAVVTAIATYSVPNKADADPTTSTPDLGVHEQDGSTEVR